MGVLVCWHCGSRLHDGKCLVRHCKGYNRPAEQEYRLSIGELPFGQQLTAMGLTGGRRVWN